MVLFVSLTYITCFIALQLSPITQSSFVSNSSGSQRMDWEESDHPSLKLPWFYVEIGSFSLPVVATDADALSRNSSQILALHWGNRHLVDDWFHHLQSLRSSWAENQSRRSSYFEALKSQNPDDLLECFCKPELKDVVLNGLCNKLMQHQQQSSLDRFLPKFSWYGASCRFHEWLFVSGSSSFPSTDMVLWSMALGAATFLFSLVLGTALGLLLVWFPAPFLLRLLSAFSYSIPSFAIVVMVFSLFLLLAPGVALPVAPAPDFRYLLFYSPIQIAEKLWLPAFASGLAPACYLAAIWEQSISKEMGQDYVRTLWAKGMSKGLGMARHVLRNALFAPMGVMVVYLPALLSGSLVMENLFSIPGMGRELMILWQQRDFEALLFLFSFQASIAVLVWSMLDILLAWADPRIRLEK